MGAGLRVGPKEIAAHRVPPCCTAALLQVIKLDIDASVVELPFMEAVRTDESLRSLIAEMNFEMHYDHKCAQRGALVASDVLRRVPAAWARLQWVYGRGSCWPATWGMHAGWADASGAGGAA